ncbi:tRNA1(Val) (adenine(37)-N6)-methyltransferase [Flavisolibacter nicotianae]|uniref:tRNA1(Val) (adenine(37)-N6)-methyltransferase n=1 Tax=Flavisolibacter nicotianae TaxID=2364882 RepID=UPI000EAFC888|nr:methyltransferase [Flavisolibacter nicotianae]
MANTYFQFKQFTVHHGHCAMKVTTDACLFGAWVADSIRSRQPANSDWQMLDIGTGTGLLALMVAQKASGIIDAIEIDPSAAQQACENVAASPWKKDIAIINGDVLQWQTNKKYDCIFSNPPFYENELKSAKAAKNAAHHDTGLKLNDLLSFIAKHLSQHGCFFLLLPAKRGKEIEGLLQKNKLYPYQKQWVQQSPAHRPFRLLIEGGKKETGKVEEKNITIRDENNNYTPGFIVLLNEYYLYL